MTRQKPHQAQTSASPMFDLHSIPGLGPIRVRALQKAGFDSLAALQYCSEESLAAIPGIGPIKARQIKNYVEQFPPTTAKTAEPLVASPSTDLSWLRVVSLPRQATPLQRAAREAFREIVAILLSPAALNYRRRLLHALLQLLQGCTLLLQQAPTETAESDNAKLLQLQSLCGLLQRTLADAVTEGQRAGMDNKAQARLARQLRKIGKDLGFELTAQRGPKR
ncbi:MAG TPA: helix-hairpin-helix domain-containing protein [Chthonomonas sp.]|uniref:helix-hairpin-helix domain-containing protein n=1 Tax=Chthonomonas sp. TaxID=2282153 RepID=UPI002B4B263C|nr:helix-hairpin-helix domain-containing protein [Chthonomonas sp.]HLI48253.1 helix-hairpin-helix domain-containing protein [Chthonomonas sp.]